MNFFTFSGIDGSGKTTQLNLTTDYLKEKNYKVVNFHLIDFSLANKIKSSSHKSSEPSPAITSASMLSILLRKAFLIVDVIRFRLYFPKLQKEGCDILITDRYFYDQIINILFLQKSFDVSVFPFWARIVLFIMIKPTRSFYVDVSPKTADARLSDAGQGIEYLEKKKMLFDMLAPKWKMISIDADRDINTINQKIIKLL